jgi:choice-of-anchor B domain-containing protein
MMSHLTLGDLGLSFANDMWGWTDPETRKDYALVGGIEGTVIVDISDPKRPDVVGILPAHTMDTNLFWRDIKVFDNHMFVVSESLGHGMQVFDLTQVRDVTGDPVVFAETAVYGEFGGGHNLAINEDTGYAYAMGTSTCAGGLHMVDISDPANPVFAGCFEDHAYIHDTQCVIYEGADLEHVGKEICFNSAADGFPPDPNTVSIVDVSDKSNPIPLSREEYPNDGYSHQGWLTPDQSYFLHNDELDEVNHGLNTTTRIWDVRDLDNLTLVEEVEHDTTSVGHNAYTEGSHAFVSNYTSGLRIFDITSVGSGEMPEEAYFDLYPENDNASFEGGTWSNYPYFAQKKIVAASSMDRGLFILRPRIGS